MYDFDKPWARQPFDTPRSFALFQEYLVQSPPRVLAHLAKGRGKDFNHEELARYARDHGWKARADAWDDHIACLRLHTIERETGRLAKAHAAIAFRVVRVASNELRKLESQSFTASELPLLKPREILDWTEKGLALENEAAGRVPEEEKGPDLSRLSLDEIKALRDLIVKATG